MSTESVELTCDFELIWNAFSWLFQNALTVLQQRSELVIRENETLYEQLKARVAEQILQHETKISDKKVIPTVRTSILFYNNCAFHNCSLGNNTFSIV